jgi:TPR repeat protein
MSVRYISSGDIPKVHERYRGAYLQASKVVHSYAHMSADEIRNDAQRLRVEWKPTMIDASFDADDNTLRKSELATGMFHATTHASLFPKMIPLLVKIFEYKMNITKNAKRVSQQLVADMLDPNESGIERGLGHSNTDLDGRIENYRSGVKRGREDSRLPLAIALREKKQQLIAESKVGNMSTDEKRKKLSEASRFGIRALAQLKAAADNGSAEAAFLYSVDIKDKKISMKYKTFSANHGFAQAQNSLGLEYDKIARAKKLKSSAAEQIDEDYKKAYTWYAKAAAQKYPQAISNLAMLHWRGQGCRQDSDTAIRLLSEASDLGNASAMYNLGIAHLNGFGKLSKNVHAACVYFSESAKHWDRDAVNKLHQLSERGLAPAKIRLAYLYEIGHELVPQDRLKAFNLYRDVSDLNPKNVNEHQGTKADIALAIRNFGEIYSEGRNEKARVEDALACREYARSSADVKLVSSIIKELGEEFDARFACLVETNDTKGLKELADSGMIEAAYVYSRNVEDHREKLKYENSAAHGGFAEAQYALALRQIEKGDAKKLTFEHRKIVDEDYKAAHIWLNKAAAQNHAESFNSLGLLRLEGLGCSRNVQSAVDFFYEAAKFGDENTVHRACRHLSDLAKVGNRSALDKLSILARARNTSAQMWLGHSYEAGTEIQNLKKAYYAYMSVASRSTENPHSIQAENIRQAQYNVGIMHENGHVEGVKQDDREACRWFAKADKLGDSAASYALGSMYEHGRGVSQDDEKALQLYAKAAKGGECEALDLLEERHGVRYDEGKLVVKDLAKAFDWLDSRSLQGDTDAQAALKKYGIRFKNNQIDLRNSFSKSSFDELVKRAKTGNDADAKTLLERIFWTKVTQAKKGTSLKARLTEYDPTQAGVRSFLNELGLGDVQNRAGSSHDPALKKYYNELLQSVKQGTDRDGERILKNLFWIQVKNGNMQWREI